MSTGIAGAFEKGAKAIDRMGEVALKAFGSKWTKRQADADDYAHQKQLDIIRNNPDMKIEFYNDEMYARERTPEELLQRAQSRQIFEAIRQQNNIENVLNFAALEASRQPDSEVSDETVDDDWVTRFFDIVKNISGEELQFVWGKILAGEIKEPGSFSLRTLDVIKNISRTEAETFQKVLPLTLVRDKTVIPSDKEILSKYGINYSMLMQLDESGLINLQEAVQMHVEITKSPTLVAHAGHYYFCANTQPEEVKRYDFGVYPFTKAGCELYNILTNGDVDENYAIDVARKMKDVNEEMIITLYRRGEADETGHANLDVVDIS